MLGSRLLLAAALQAPARRVLTTPVRGRAGGPSMSWYKEAASQGVEFVGSFTDAKSMPRLQVPEITLAGRSNVGKSSALNALSCRRKKVAKVSKTPGRTRLINLFKVGKACAVTDLPGYGFAKVSEEMQEGWRKAIEGYLRGRENLRMAVLFVDAQLQPQKSDAQLLDFLLYNDLPTVVVATKVDKLNKAQLADSLGALRDGLDLPPDQPLAFSAQAGIGTRELWQYLQEHAA